MKIVVVLFAAISLAASAQEKQLPKATEAWKWTIEQRIAARLDANGMAERRRAHIQRNHDDPNDTPPMFVIDGETNPELFLPHELISFLVVDSDPRYPAARVRYEPILAQFGWKQETFWSDVRSVAAGYIQLQEQYPRPTGHQARQLCALRAAALGEMRQRYDRFDEFLYVGVAPRGTYFSADVHSASWLMWLEGGCR